MAVLFNRGGLDNINTSSRPLAATLDARAALALKTGAAASAGGIGDWILRARKPYTAQQPSASPPDHPRPSSTRL